VIKDRRLPGERWMIVADWGVEVTVDYYFSQRSASEAFDEAANAGADVTMSRLLAIKSSSEECNEEIRGHHVRGADK
jgi:hypothetical protein